MDRQAPSRGSSPSARWQFWIDRGGTFTDCLGRDPDGGRIHTAKVLSSDRAPLIAIRRILGLAQDEPIPPCELRMGTTIATNALLERRGSDCALLITRGFRDLLDIGNQTRPEIFALDIHKPEHLYREVIELDARVDPDGQVLSRAEPEVLAETLRGVRARGLDSLAVVVLHAYAGGELEREIGAVAERLGFGHVSLSHQVAAEIGMVGRGDTTVVDAYLTPLIRDYVAALMAELPGSSLRIMQSSGGLTAAERFRGRNAVLSGPAGGVVAAAQVARAAGYERAIGFDMGGTSTDVSCYDGAFEREYENEVAGVRLRAPMMAIHTVAAGGGSLCEYRGFRLVVGPHSAGAEPGPLCYGRAEAETLALTDINLALGRVVDDRFPFPLERAPVERALRALVDELRTNDGHDYDPETLAAGFFAIANASMAEAIRQVSVAKGRDVRDYALVVFGGAGGQHACPIARQLGIRTLIFDRFAGVLSAYGMGLADVTWHGEADAGRATLDRALAASLAPSFARLVETGHATLVDEGFRRISCRRRLDLRYRGTDTALPIDLDPGDQAADAAALRDPAACGFDPEAVREAFEAAHRRLFGYHRADHPVEATAVRVEVIGADRPAGELLAEAAPPPPTPPTLPAPRRRHRMWTGSGVSDQVPVYRREDLPAGARLVGPVLILDDTGTIAVDPGFALEVGPSARLIMRDTAPLVASAPADDTRLDPVRLEIFNNLFMSIATQMGNALRRTAQSTNIRERLDFSCAVFDAEGGLVANAPHIPVHLGAMGESIKGVLAAHPAPAPGLVFATNDPAHGGSHLPDITLVTPVHDADGELVFFTASRGHHADIGGITPGSMPPFSRALSEEGAVFRAVPIVRQGRFDEVAVRAVLEAGPHPARDPRANIADLEAQIAANRTGAHLLEALIAHRGKATVAAYMGHVQDNAAAQVSAEIARIEDGTYRFEDALDSGARVAVTLQIQGDRLHVDFTGTDPQLDSNLNAPRAVTVAAVIYVLRALVGAPIPLNSGCLRPVELVIPPGSLLSPDPDRAVAGGNVETSQRIVDVLLGALGRAAASQGTMNNLTFGNDHFGYYETIAGGAGATPARPGASGVHTHMTNTRITDPEVLEARYPVRLREFSLRRGSGGAGRHRGGDGVIREFELRAPMRISILSERRVRAPFGLAGGEPGQVGRNLHNGRELAGKASFDAGPGDVIRIETPGGGGFGAA
ncbi:hydantoinase B/oxoprolinase family protein [Haliangium sp.]|uniref:hydantoinase B/oxoprolinase family protein n=1 Tax=Haliangium sp. TaxID=2663208 RepID=UPI003D0E8ECA